MSLQTSADAPSVPAKPSKPAITYRIWSRYGHQLIIPLFIIATTAEAVLQSVHSFFAGDEFHEGDGVARSLNLLGFYSYGIVTLTVVLVLSFTLVRPSELGIFFTKEENKASERAYFATVGLAFGAITVCNAIRSVLERYTPLPTRPMEFSFPFGHELLYVLRSGLFEEIFAATLIILCLRAKWRPAFVVVLVAAVRASYHLYQGVPALIWAAAWSAGFAVLFLRFRRVGPLILAHTTYNLAGFVLTLLVGPPTVLS